MPRIRHCVECPKCRTRYLIAFSPYGNGSYLVPTVDGCQDEYILYCACTRIAVASRWKWNELQACEISRSAYERGYGTGAEISLIHSEAASWAPNIAGYLTNWELLHRRKNSP
jgi:hypothetical protein